MLAALHAHLVAAIWRSAFLIPSLRFTLCRNFTAGAQEWDNTWVNHYEPFVRQYGDETSFELTKGAPLFWLLR